MHPRPPGHCRRLSPLPPFGSPGGVGGRPHRNPVLGPGSTLPAPSQATLLASGPGDAIPRGRKTGWHSDDRGRRVSPLKKRGVNVACRGNFSFKFNSKFLRLWLAFARTTPSPPPEAPCSPPWMQNAPSFCLPFAPFWPTPGIPWRTTLVWKSCWTGSRLWPALVSCQLALHWGRWGGGLCVETHPGMLAVMVTLQRLGQAS